MSEQLNRIEKKLDSVCTWIHGTNGNPGAKVRIDRLEGHVRRSDKICWMVILAILATTGTVIATIVTRGG